MFLFWNECSLQQTETILGWALQLLMENKFAWKDSICIYKVNLPINHHLQLQGPNNPVLVWL